MKFKVGDKVRGQYNYTIYTGEIVSIDDKIVTVRRDDNGLSWSYLIDDGIHNLELLTSSTNKIMKITTLVKKLLDSDTRALVEAGYINGDLELTEEGKDELLTIMFESNKQALIELAKAKLEEQKKK